MSRGDGEGEEVQLCLELPPEILLQLGAEGGSWTLLRKCEPDGRHTYMIHLNQALFDDMEPEGAPHSREWEGLDLRRAVLQLCAHGPFTTLHPIRVHPDIMPVLRTLLQFERLFEPDRRLSYAWEHVFANGACREF